ncbi:MAG TPA: 1-deoxy-D-xylulose-5-phosphate synthase [Gammaproteobacteria bacterium]|nr:1-deoxy-D-xylulose-5-phosphate synthase [Gammaproteobacteria bacterium]
MFNKIPNSRPDTPLLDTIEDPSDLRKLAPEQLTDLARELRHFLLYSVGQTGGHFGAGLGVIELTIALHYSYNTPIDQLIWDVGHQTYPHKILTGRRERMHTLRQPDGLAPFPSQSESIFDVFGTGHSSTSISAALGIELANKNAGRESHTVVVIGDGAMTAGMAFEALNHVAACQANLTIVLNDNAMSISENVGGLANYFARNISAYELDNTGPVNGEQQDRDTTPGSIFTDLGFRYTGPVDGHDIDVLLENLDALRAHSGPKLLHLITKKGKGYAPAETSPVSSHSLTKLEKQSENRETTYSSVFGEWITRKAATDNRLFAITPAMEEGSGLTQFSEQFPNRFHDVAIAEQHAVTLAAGLATGGAKPVVAIYSTFLQRAFDQLIHDVAIQNLDVLFAVDRASLLEDGPTHSGVFDYSFVRAIPNMVIMSPSNRVVMEQMLDFGFEYKGPCVVRYPRGTATTGTQESPLQLGKAHICRNGKRAAILAFGTTRNISESVAENLDLTLIDMRFVKPLDTELITELTARHELLVTIEENAIAGGAGSAVNEYVISQGLECQLLNLGVPDLFIDQDEPANMRKVAGLTAASLESQINSRL